MNNEEKEIFVAKVKGLPDEAAVHWEMKQKKPLLIHYAQKEDWEKVADLAEELKILHEERILRLEARCQ